MSFSKQRQMRTCFEEMLDSGKGLPECLDLCAIETDSCRVLGR